MQRWANWIRGWAAAEVTGPDREEFLNLCARQGIPFWRVELRAGMIMTLRVPHSKWRALERLGRGGRWEVKLLRRGGLTGLLYRLRYRYGLFLGLVCAMGAVAVLSRFVLTVRVSGNVDVPTGAILAQLRAQGVKPGVFGPGLDTREAAHRVLLELPQLSWMSINLRGTVAQVLVREGDPPVELVEETAPAHVTARYSGIIVHMETTSGMALVEEGDTVAAGDTLISSWVDFPEPDGYAGDAGGLLVRASGRIVARTWHTLTAQLPLTGREKVYTGEEKTRWSAEILGRPVNFFENGSIPFEKCDKMTVYRTVRLPGGQALPVTLRKEVLRAYTLRDCPVDRARGEALLKARLGERLAALADKGEVLRTDYRTECRDGLMTVTLLAECRQEIGQTVED